MPDYTFRISVTTDPETITFASLSTSLEGRSIPATLPDTDNIPAAWFQSEDDDVTFRISSINTSGGNYVSLTLDASDFDAGTIPYGGVLFIRTFDTVSSVSNAKSTTNSRIRRLLQITNANQELTDAEIDERVDDAVEIYSKHRPRKVRNETVGNGEHEYLLPSNWVDRFSTIKFIEYPAGGQPPNYIDANEYYTAIVDDTERTLGTATSGESTVTMSTVTDAGFFKDGEIVTISDASNTETNWVTADGNTSTGVIAIKNTLSNSYTSTPVIKKVDHLKFLLTEPLSSDVFRMEYMTTHTHTDASDTIPNNDFEAFTWLAASLCAYSLSAQFGLTTRSGFDADSVDNLAKPVIWRQIAEDLMKQYKEHLGISDDKPQTAFTAFIDTDARFLHGRSFLFHPRRLQ